MTRLKRISERILGESKNPFSEERILISLILLAFFLSLMAAVINQLQGLNPYLSYGDIITALFFVLYYWLVRFRGKVLLVKWLVSITVLVMLDILWLNNGASQGRILFLFVIAFTVIFMMFSGKSRNMVILLLVTDLLLLYYIDLVHPELITPSYDDNRERHVNIYASLGLYMLVATVLLGMIKNRLKREMQNAFRADRHKSAFLANMSHEIRTPLNSILGFSQLLESDLSGHDRKDYINTINDSGIYLLQLIEDIIDISKIEAGQVEIRKGTFDLKELCGELESIFLQELQKQGRKGIRLEVRVPQGITTIEADRQRLRQVLFNLLSNAEKFTNKGLISFGCEAMDGMLVFFVKDTGIGIDPSYHSEIFERFMKIEHRGPDRVYRGTGIGLSICMNLVELMGGRIWVESEPGKGSIFRFTIPQPGSKVAQVSSDRINAPSPVPDLAGRTILLVEDDEFSHLFFREILKKTGVNLLHASSGQEALSLLKANPGIDLVLMDLKLPVMDGFETTKRMKKLKPGMPVIAQTAYAMIGDREKCLKAGCDDYLSKPVKKEILISILRDYLVKS